MTKVIERNKTNQIVKEAMSIVSKDVRAPRVVRQGVVTLPAKTVSKPVRK